MTIAKRDKSANVYPGIVGRAQELKHWYQELDDNMKSLLIFLTIILTIALLIFWIQICCSLACSGYETLALLLFLAGSTGFIYGCVRVIQRIVKGTWKQRRSTKTASAN
jgi:hypothetical protein